MLKSLRETNFPVAVRFGGFESNTFTLQRAGWEISMEQLPHDRSIRLAMHHPAFELYGISASCTMDYYMLHDPMTAHQYLAEFGFDIKCMYNKIQVKTLMERGPMCFKAIDATPSFSNIEIKNLEDLIPFRPIGGDLVYVDPKDVDALLTYIKKAQSPKQAEIREKLRKEKMRLHSKYTTDLEYPYENVIQLVKVA